ncbi:MAG: hypothetical protein ACOYI5_03320 [Christensenellales bacterium]|jgi:hypothetical protein
MQTPAEMLRRANAARPRSRAAAEVTVEERRDMAQRRLVMNPVRTNGVYRTLMEKHDRMGTRHLK